MSFRRSPIGKKKASKWRSFPTREQYASKFSEFGILFNFEIHLISISTFDFQVEVFSRNPRFESVSDGLGGRSRPLVALKSRTVFRFIFGVRRSFEHRRTRFLPGLTRSDFQIASSTSLSPNKFARASKVAWMRRFRAPQRPVRRREL